MSSRQQTWTSSTEIIVGKASEGSLLVDHGSDIASKAAHVGRAVGFCGTATVSGAGSTWTSYSLAVGGIGSGVLRIEAGGQISDTAGFLSSSSNSSSTVVVTGASSTWTNSGSLSVGGTGNSTLTVSDGGLVTAGTLYASLSNLQGNGTITANGIVLDADVVFDSTHTPIQSLPFGTGGTLNLMISSGNGNLEAGYQAGGTLRVSDGVAVTSSNGYLGYSAGSSGIATVSGTGSTWNNRNNLYVGSSGSGMLTVVDGGLVTAGTLYASLSNLAGNGTISANGAVLDADLVFDETHGTAQNIPFGTGGALNLTVEATSVLGVGYKGNGSMRIAEGITVTSKNACLGYNAGSSGTATVTGTGSTWTNTSGGIDVGYYGAGVLHVQNGAQIITNSGGSLGYNSGSSGAATVSGAGSAWSTGNNITIGFNGTGSLRIEAGGQVSDRTSHLGEGAGSRGTAIVDGTGSKWVNSSDLYVGGSGDGSLTVSNGGLVTARTLYASLGNLAGDGTITVNDGVVLDADLVFDSAHGTTQSVAFGSGGTLNLTVSTTGVLGTGYKTSGNLRITGGATVASSSGYLGYNAGSTGTATVSGATSAWNNTSDLQVGYYGNGTLSIESGAHVSNGSLGYLGYLPGSNGRAVVRGQGSTWTSFSLNVGGSGSGTLTIEAGAQARDSIGYLGTFTGSHGAAVVTGAGSMWANTSNLYIGNKGSGMLTISDGGEVTARSVSINSQSLLAIDIGNGSKLTVNNGTGTLTNNGTVRILAGAGAAPGVPYHPISAGSYGNIANYQSVGGKWDPAAHAFMVCDAIEGGAAAVLSIDLFDKQRIRVIDPNIHWSLGASFMGATSTKTLNFAATPINGLVQTSLTQLLNNEPLLGGWQFAVDGGYMTGDPVYLSFDVGANRTRSVFAVWRYDGAMWTTYEAPDLIYDGRYASFGVTDLSGYAVSTVPEPGTLALSAVSLLAIGCAALRRQCFRGGRSSLAWWRPQGRFLPQYRAMTPKNGQ